MYPMYESDLTGLTLLQGVHDGDDADMDIDIDALIEAMPAVELAYENLYRDEVQLLCSLPHASELTVEAMCA